MHVERADSGRVMNEPFDQAQMNKNLLIMLDAEQQAQWMKNALSYAQTEDLYSRIEAIVAAIEKRAGKQAKIA